MFDTARFSFIADALHGSGGFRPVVSYDSYGKASAVVGASFLVRYPSETDIRFARRNDVAWYSNDMRRSCMRYSGYIAAHPPAREIGQPLLADMAKDCDGRGNSIDDFWSSFVVEAKARGSMLLLVDMPKAIPADQASQQAARAFPYLASIAPERVLKYALNYSGAFTFVEVSAEWNGKPAVRGWSDTGWYVRQGGEVVEQGSHHLGICPVLIFSEIATGEEGEFAQIADIARRLFNLRSELDEILRSQTFSILAFPLPDDVMMNFSDTAHKISEIIGTQNMLMHATGSQPAFIAPPDGPARVYGETIAKMESLIRDAGLDVELPQGQESGLAMSLRFSALNASLERFARKMEQLERRVWWLAAKWLGVADSSKINWQTRFALSDSQTELEELQQMQAAAMPDETIREKQKDVIASVFASKDEEEIARLLASVDEAEQEAAGSEELLGEIGDGKGDDNA